MKTRIIIEVSGGVVQSVYADRPVSVDVLDRDDQEASSNPERFEKLEQETETMKAYY